MRRASSLSSLVAASMRAPIGKRALSRTAGKEDAKTARELGISQREAFVVGIKNYDGQPLRTSASDPRAFGLQYWRKAAAKTGGAGAFHT